LVDGKRAEHAARLVILRDERVLNAETREEIAGLEAPGAAPDDDYWVDARREGPVGWFVR
jgi:hypothetical protein